MGSLGNVPPKSFRADFDGLNFFLCLLYPPQLELDIRIELVRRESLVGSAKATLLECLAHS